MREVVIVSAVRTAVGKTWRTCRVVSATNRAVVIKEAISRAKISQHK